MFMNNFTKCNGTAKRSSISNLLCCSIGLNRLQVLKPLLVLVLFVFSSVSVFSQQRSTFYEVCFSERPLGLTAEQAMALFPDAECDGDLKVEKTEVVISDSDCSWAITYDYTLYCGDEELAIEKLSYEGGDLSAPELTIPADMTVECDAVPEVGDASATDNCDDDVDIKFDGEVRTDGFCEDTYTLTRTWTATDNCGNETTLSQTISVQDTTAPELTVPSDVTVECDSVPEAATGEATDNCDSDVTIQYLGETRADGAVSDSYTLTRHWKATDNCGNSSFASQVITVEDTTAPMLSKGAVVPTGETGLNLCYDSRPEGPSETEIGALFTDNCGNVNVSKELVFKGDDCAWKGYVTYTITDDCGNESDSISLYYSGGDTEAPVFVDAPADIEVSCIDLIPANYMLAWTDNCSSQASKSKKGLGVDDTSNLGEACEGGSLTRTWTAADACGNEVSHTQTITVTPAPSASFDSLEDIEITCEDLASFEAGSLGYSNGGSGACDISGSVVGVAEAFTENCGSFTVTYTYSDTCNDLEYVQTVTVIDETAPELMIPADATVECDAIPEVGEATATDNCDTDVAIQYLGQKKTPGDCENNYTLIRIWRATDSCGNSSVKSQVLTVQDTTAPELTIPADVTVECDAVPSIGEASAMDNCDDNADVKYDGEERTDGFCEDTYTLTRTWTATDNCGNATTLSQTITVQDTTAPELTVPADVTVECHEVPEVASGEATDNCDSDVMIKFLGETRADGDCANSYTLTRHWSATDNCGNATTETQVITVEDTTAPEITVPADVTVECDMIPEIGVASAIDNCDEGATAEFVKEEKIDGDCEGAYQLVRVFIAEDACGNFVLASQTITVIDTTGPVFAGVGEDAKIECPEDVVFSEPTATDACSSMVTVTFEDDEKLDECGLGYITRTWTATDDCDNSTMASQTITIEDNTDPVISGVEDDYTSECSDDLVWSEPTVSDACDDKPSLEMEETQQLDYCGLGTVTRTWTATDCAGNTSVESQTITIEDTTNPVITGVGEDFSVECPEGFEFSEPTFSDNCTEEFWVYNSRDCEDNYPEMGTEGAPELGYVQVCTEENLDDCGLGTITRTWTAYDCYGNMSTDSQTVTIEDNTAPVITGVEEDYTVDCPDELVWSEPTVTDTCTDDFYFTPCFEDNSSVTFTESTLTIVGSDYDDDEGPYYGIGPGPGFGGYLTAAYIECVETLEYSFDWDYSTEDGPMYDIAFYVNGEPIPLVDIEDEDANNQSGSMTVTCLAGDVIGFGIDSTDGCCGAGTLVISNFMAGETSGFVGDFAEENWNIVSMPSEFEGEGPEANGVNPEEPDYSIGFVQVCTVENLDDCGLGTVTRTWTAYDCAGNMSSDSQTITIQDITDPVISGVEDDYTVECPEDLVWSEPTAFDACSGSETITIDCKILIEDMNTDIVNVEVTFTQIGRDEYDNALYSDEWIELKLLDNTYVRARANLVYNPEMYDEHYYVVVENTIPVFRGDMDENGNASCDPSDWEAFEDVCQILAISCDDGVLPLTFEDDDKTDACGLGTITRTWTATDCAGNTSSESQTITIEDNTAPVIVAFDADYTSECPDDLNWFEPTAYDACSDLESITIDCTIRIEELGIETVNVTASFDKIGEEMNGIAIYSSELLKLQYEGNTYVQVNANLYPNEDGYFYLVVENEIPVFRGAINEEGNASCNASDWSAPYDEICEVLTVTCEGEASTMITYEDDDKTDECGLGTITRTWTATDCAGNESTASQTITIEDNVDPYFNEELPQDITNVDCESVPEAAVLTASDACDQDIKVDFEQVRDDGNCAGNYTLTRTWSASDCAGNSIEHVQVIHVTDTTPPVLVGDLPESMNELNACQGAYMDAPLSEEEFALLFTDNCSDVVVSLDTSAVGDDCGWSVMHKYAVSDDCGNSLGNFKVYYSGSDMTAPELMEAPADVTVSCDDIPEAKDLMAMDCTGDFSVEAVDTVQSVGDEGCSDIDITRTWTAVDNCGNETVHTQVIQVRDMEAPELTGDLPEGTNENDACAPESDEELAALGVLTASEFTDLYTDDCNTVVVNREHNIDGDDCKWIMWVRYDVSDSCGNEAQSVKLWYHGGDATAPEITKAEDVTEECDGTDDALNAWLADNGGNTATDCGEFTWTNDYDSRESTEGDGCTTVTTVTFTATDACGN